MGSDLEKWYFYDSLSGEFDGIGMFENGEMVGIAPVSDDSWPKLEGKLGNSVSINLDTAGIYRNFTALVQFHGNLHTTEENDVPIKITVTNGEIELIDEKHQMYHITPGTNGDQLIIDFNWTNGDNFVSDIEQFVIPIFEDPSNEGI